MPDGNPIVIALREFFGPLIKLTVRLPAALAYALAAVLSLLVLILLGAVIPDNLVWLLGIIILAGLVAFVIGDWSERRRVAAPTTDLTVRGNVYYDDGAPIKDARVFVEGIKFYTESDRNGWFQIEIDEREAWTVKAIYGETIAEETVTKDEILQPVRLVLPKDDLTEPSRDDQMGGGGNEMDTPEHETAKDLILEYLERTGFTMVSFERIRKNIDPAYDDDFLMDVIRLNRTLFRRAILTGSRPGVALK